MFTINVHEAKTNLSRLLARVEAGEEIVISKAGQPIARLVPWQEQAENRKPGLDKGKLVIPEDFDDPLPKDILDSFES